MALTSSWCDSKYWMMVAEDGFWSIGVNTQPKKAVQICNCFSLPCLYLSSLFLFPCLLTIMCLVSLTGSRVFSVSIDCFYAVWLNICLLRWWECEVLLIFPFLCDTNEILDSRTGSLDIWYPKQNTTSFILVILRVAPLLTRSLISSNPKSKERMRSL